MKALFSPYRIKRLELRNRIVMPAIASFLTEAGGRITQRTIEHYKRRAAGGAAMVMMEACAVSAEGIVSENQTRIFDDQHVEGLHKIARVIRSEGTIAAIQLHHGGRQISPKVINRKPLAPSPLPCPTIQTEVAPLSPAGIHQLVKKFGDAAVRAREAGYQLVEIHGAHGYLVSQFLSAFSNIREDEYGGDTVRRTRFAREIVEETRQRLGDNFPISFKISAQEFVSNGLTVGETIDILKILMVAGIDIVQVSAGNDSTPEWICQPIFMKKACLADSASEIKQALNIPVMAVGRINDPITASKIIEENKADIVCMARGLIADPDLPRKAAENRIEDIRPCMACNTCMQSIFRKGRLECMVNPTVGRESEMDIRPADHPKRVMVVGGGPAGLNTAWIAAQRGHTVHLYEKDATVGGKLMVGSEPRYKREIRHLIRFQHRQAEKHGVFFHMGQEVTLETVKQAHPDVVVVATGSLPANAPIDVDYRDLVVPLEIILNGMASIRKSSVVIGGGASGCETALHLAEAGSEVTLIETLPRIGSNLEAITKKLMIQNLKKRKIEILTETRVIRITKKGVWIAGRDDQVRLVETQRVVLAIGYRPDHHLYNQVKSLGCKVHQIGDCKEPRNAKEAIREGALLGRAI